MAGQVATFGPTRRGGPVFRWLGEPLAIDLANTIMVVREGETIDLLGEASDLRRWFEHERERLGDCGFALEHHVEVLGLRDAIHTLLRAAVSDEAPPSDALGMVNAASMAAPVAPQIASSYEPAVEELATDPLVQLMGRLARSAIDLLGGRNRERLRICQAPSCGMFYLGARRWCCSACGNRARAARHYARTRPSQRRSTKH